MRFAQQLLHAGAIVKYHATGSAQLRKLLRAGEIASLRFVFVSACFSEAAAQAFVEAGVPHVVAVRLSTRVSDHAAHAFTRAFYLALAVGSSIQAQIPPESHLNPT